MEEKSKVLYLSLDTRVAVHNAVFDGISRYAAMRGWTAESVNYRLSHDRSLPAILAEKRPIGCIVECSNGPPDLAPAAFVHVPAVFMNCLSAPRGRRIARVAVDNGTVAAAALHFALSRENLRSSALTICRRYAKPPPRQYPASRSTTSA